MLIDLVKEKLENEGIYDAAKHPEYNYLYWNYWMVWECDITFNGTGIAFFQGSDEGNCSFIRIYKESYNLNYMISHEDSLDPVECNFIIWHGESVICLYRNTCNIMVSLTGTTIIKLDILEISDIAYLSKDIFCYKSEPGIVRLIQLPGLKEIKKIKEDEFNQSGFDIIKLDLLRC